MVAFRSPKGSQTTYHRTPKAGRDIQSLYPYGCLALPIGRLSESSLSFVLPAVALVWQGFWNGRPYGYHRIIRQHRTLWHMVALWCLMHHDKDKVILKAATSIAFIKTPKAHRLMCLISPIRLLMVPYVREAALVDKVS